jgi:hypothetical protein
VAIQLIERAESARAAWPHCPSNLQVFFFRTISNIHPLFHFFLQHSPLPISRHGFTRNENAYKYLKSSNNTEMRVSERLPQLEKTLNTEIDEAEAELRALQKRLASEQNSSTQSRHPPHWDPVMAFLHRGQEGETLFALIHIVQRLLDEKAHKAAAGDKASKSYVDSLFQRVTVGVQENLHQCTSDSVSRLQEKINDVHQKITDLRKFLQIELHDIQTELADLQQLSATDSKVDKLLS